jgi:hypothetical protein
MTMRFNGWQRLWVVLTSCWTLVVGAFTWAGWPGEPDWFARNAPLQFEVTAPNGKKLEIRTPDGRLPTAVELENIFRESGNGSMTLAQRVRAKYPGVYDALTDQQIESRVKAEYPGIYDDLPMTPRDGLSIMKSESASTALIEPIDLKSVIRVETPAGILEFAAGTPVDAVQRAYDGKLAADVHARRMRVGRQALAFWLIPPLGMYVFGAAAGWVYRGFRPSRGPTNSHDQG